MTEEETTWEPPPGTTGDRMSRAAALPARCVGFPRGRFGAGRYWAHTPEELRAAIVAWNGPEALEHYELWDIQSGEEIDTA